MAKNRSNKSPFPSRYSVGHWVTPAQYVIEFVCEQAARHSGRDLPQRFWKDPEWSQFFISQTRYANKLLKNYTATAIINAVKKHKLRALQAKWIVEVIQKEQRILDGQKKLVTKKSKDNPVSKTKKQQTRKNKFSSSTMDKLLALDEEIENE